MGKWKRTGKAGQAGSNFGNGGSDTPIRSEMQGQKFML
jgi:hypothetical protein